MEPKRASIEPPRKTLPQVIEKSKARPTNMTIPLYRVIFHNDDTTTFAFVAAVIMLVFGKSPEEARRLTLEVHHENAAVVGVYALEHAEMKRDEVLALARERGFPLQVTIEPEI